ncbi:hypothetical protein CAL7716_085190 [Calothrix sp. PCC 7716]|nr:hypothetical protein CAL7716_085190 [Calothrix sp. PCC 7716]
MIDARVNFDAFDNCCAYCYQKGVLIAEHVIPESKGGATGAVNCVPACLKCNRAKKNQHPWLWFSRQASFTEERWQKILLVLGITDEYINSMFDARKVDNTKIACKLPQLMEEKGINQKQLASATGLSPTTISKLYRNQLDRFDRNTILKLCEFFKCQSIAELIEIKGFSNE